MRTLGALRNAAPMRRWELRMDAILNALIDLAADVLAVALALCATFGGVRAVHVAPTIEVP